MFRLRRLFSNLSHVDHNGKARMVDISNKTPTKRTAIARTDILINNQILEAIQQNEVKKGDVFSVAKIAGIQAAKNCSQIIPLCHQVDLSNIDVVFKIDLITPKIEVYSEATTIHSTGVEMEALVASHVSALTVYDMCKAISKTMVIQNGKLIKKTGGKSGDFTNLS